MVEASAEGTFISVELAGDNHWTDTDMLIPESFTRDI